MKLLLAKSGSTATPSNPRSPLTQMRLPRSTAGVASRLPFWKTRNCPPCVMINSLWSGVKAIAVGPPISVTSAFSSRGVEGGGVGAGNCVREVVIQAVVKRASVITMIGIRVRKELSSLICQPLQADVTRQKIKLSGGLRFGGG